MAFLDRLLGHDAWTTRLLLDRSESLTDGQLDREFEIGHRTVRATFAHIIGNMEVWADLMAGRPVGATAMPRGESIPQLKKRLENAAADLAAIARSIAQRGAWDDRFIDTADDPPTAKTFGGGIAHVVTHSMHHRAQLLYLLRQLGVPNLPEGDVLSWEQRTSQRG